MWLRCPPVAPPLGCGLLARASARAVLPNQKTVSAGTMSRVGSGSGSGPGLGAGRLRDGVSVGRTAGPAGGPWCLWDAGSACARTGGCPRGADALGVARACGLGLSVGLWAWGCTVPRSRALVVSVGVAVRVSVGGLSKARVQGLPSARLVCCGVGRAPSGRVLPLPGWLPAVGRVWTRRVVFGVVELGRPFGPALGPFAGVRCEGGARVGCLPPPYSWGWAWPLSQQVTRGAPGSLWLRGGVAGVVVPPVSMHVLVAGSVACRPPMVPERL